MRQQIWKQCNLTEIVATVAIAMKLRIRIEIYVKSYWPVGVYGHGSHHVTTQLDYLVGTWGRTVL